MTYSQTMPLSGLTLTVSSGGDFWQRHGPGILLNVRPPTVGYAMRDIDIIRAGWWPFRSTRTVYEFDLDAVHPMTLMLEDGTCVQPNKHAVSDGLSIPPFVEWWTGIEHDRCPVLGYWHDSGYSDGGYFVRYCHEREYRFREFTRNEVDQIVTILGPQAPPVRLDAEEIQTLYRGLDWFGWVAWDRHRAADRQTGRVGHRHEYREGRA